MTFDALLLVGILIGPPLTALLVARSKSNKRIKSVGNYVVVKRFRGRHVLAGIRVESIDDRYVEKNLEGVVREYLNVLATCCPGVDVQVVVKRKHVNKDEIIRKLEREITSLRVILESDPSNARVEAKLRRLEKLYSILRKGNPPTCCSTYIIVKGESMSNVDTALNIVEGILKSLFKSEVKRLRGNEILKVLSPIRREKCEVAATTSLLLSLPYVKNPDLDGVYVGRNEAGEPVFLSVDDFRMHLGVFGSTGSGKTTLAFTLAKRLSEIEEVEILVFDPKGDLAELCKAAGLEALVYVPGRREELREFKQVVEREFEREILRRVLNAKSSDRIRTLVMVDEAWLLSHEVLEVLLREGRSRGVGVVVISQSVKDLPSQLLTNVSTLFVMRHNKKDIEDVGLRLGKYVDEVPTLGTGEAILVRGTRIEKVVVEPDYTFTLTTLKSRRSSSESLRARSSSSAEAGSSAK